jgi:hypothetical protein
MHEPLYTQALRHGWRVVSRGRSLLIFGFFATFLGQLGLMDILSKVFSITNTTHIFDISLRFWRTYPQSFISLYESSLSSIFLLVALFIIIAGIGVLLVLVAVSSQGAIISASADMARHKKVDFRRSMLVGIRHVWRLLFLNIFRRLSVLIIGVVLGATALRMVGVSAGANAVFVLVSALALLLGAIVSFVTFYSAGYVVVEDRSFFRALYEGWRLFVEHPLVSMEVAMIILLLNVITTTLAIFGLFFIIFPMAILSFFGTSFGGGIIGGVIISIIIFLYTAFVVFMGSAFTVFHVAVWTDLFMVMHSRGISSRILHFFKR